MTFRILQNSTTADPSDMNDNYYHIGQGSIIPMSGVSLSSVDSTCDLGSSSYKWDNGHFDTIECDLISYTGSISSDKFWTKITGFSGTASSFSISVNGDSDKTYLMYNESSTGAEVILNGDSSSSYLVNQFGLSPSGTASSLFNYTISSMYVYHRAILNVKSGLHKTMISVNAALTYTVYRITRWISTATVTSIAFQSISPSNFKIYRSG